MKRGSIIGVLVLVASACKAFSTENTAMPEVDAGSVPPDGASSGALAEAGPDPEAEPEDLDAGPLPDASCALPITEEFNGPQLAGEFTKTERGGGTLGLDGGKLRAQVTAEDDSSAFASRTLCGINAGPAGLRCSFELTAAVPAGKVALLEMRGRINGGPLITARLKTNELQLSGVSADGATIKEPLSEVLTMIDRADVALVVSESGVTARTGPSVSGATRIAADLTGLVLTDVRIGAIYIMRAGATTAADIHVDSLTCHVAQ